MILHVNEISRQIVSETLMLFDHASEDAAGDSSETCHHGSYHAGDDDKQIGIIFFKNEYRNLMRQYMIVVAA